MRQPYLTQIIINIIPGMDRSIANPTSAIKPPLAINEVSQAIKHDFNYRLVIGLLNFIENSTRPGAQFAVHQCAQFSADTKLPHNQEVKRFLKYLKGVSLQGLIMKPGPEKVTEFYSDYDFAGGWNQEEGKDLRLVISITGYVISYANCPIIWGNWIQTEIALSTTEIECIALYQEIRYILSFVGLMK